MLTQEWKVVASNLINLEGELNALRRDGWRVYALFHTQPQTSLDREWEFTIVADRIVDSELELLQAALRKSS